MSSAPAPLLVSILLLLITLLLSSPLPILSARCHKSDLHTLLAIRSELGNPYLLISWGTAAAGPCCDWYGVTCDAADRVVEFGIFGDNISAPFPPSVAAFPRLTSLTLHKLTSLYGPIPESIAALTNLTFLRLDWNSFSGPVPSFLAKLTSLTYLNLAFNQFTGSIPPSLGSLPLEFIRLDRNRLTGSIPAELAEPPSQYLYLSHNNLTGPIPSSFASVGFQTIDLSRNRLAGDASILFGKSKALQFLDLSRNLFEFDLSGVELPEGLVALDVNHNKIYGRIPEAFTGPAWQEFNVSYNRLCGPIPQGGSLQDNFDEYAYLHNRCLCGAPLPPCK